MCYSFTVSLRIDDVTNAYSYNLHVFTYVIIYIYNYYSFKFIFKRRRRTQTLYDTMTDINDCFITYIVYFSLFIHDKHKSINKTKINKELIILTIEYLSGRN